MRKMVYIPLIVGILGFGGIVLADADSNNGTPEFSNVQEPVAKGHEKTVETVVHQEDDDDVLDMTEKVTNQEVSFKQEIISPEQEMRAALKVAPGTVEEVELERDDGKVYYEIEIENGHYEYEVKVHGFNGSILEIEKDDD